MSITWAAYIASSVVNGHKLYSISHIAANVYVCEFHITSLIQLLACSQDVKLYSINMERKASTQSINLLKIN